MFAIIGRRCGDLGRKLYPPIARKSAYYMKHLFLLGRNIFRLVFKLQRS
jgi:hypothetical protein